MESTPDNGSLRWRQFKKGDRDAFAAIYQQHIVSLIAYGLRLCPDRDLLKDQIQELFVELWNTRENLSHTDSVKFYLFKALRYKLIRLEKTRHSREALLSHAPEWAGDQLHHPVETSIVEQELAESRIALLKKALHDLTARQQEVIHLRFYQGFTHDQIALLLNMNHQSVSNLLHRALVRLRDKLRLPVALSLLLLLFLFA